MMANDGDGQRNIRQIRPFLQAPPSDKPAP